MPSWKSGKERRSPRSETKRRSPRERGEVRWRNIQRTTRVRSTSRSSGSREGAEDSGGMPPTTRTYVGYLRRRAASLPGRPSLRAPEPRNRPRALRRAANPRRPGARVSVPTLGLDGAAGPNTVVDFLAPNPMVLSQRVEEPAQASRKRALPASEPPLEQRQVERVNHLSETRLTEQLVHTPPLPPLHNPE